MGTMWPCEGSSRQKWNLVASDDGSTYQIQVGKSYDDGQLCVAGQVDGLFEGLLLKECWQSGYFEMEAYTADDGTISEDDGFVKMVLTGQDSEDTENSCLVVKPLENEGGTYGERGGAQVALGDCGGSSAMWKVSASTGEISSFYFDQGEVCLTTGWPFLQIGAFQHESSKIAVILNEASQPANFELRDGNTVIMTSSIPAHSIQTVTFED